MKKKILILFMACLLLCGCKKDSFEDINIYTTAYPFRYVVEALYGEPVSYTHLTLPTITRV